METDLYDQLWEIEQQHWWFQARREIVRSLMRRFTDRPKDRLRICDLGCGTGGNLAALAGEHEVVGVECSPLALDYARRRLGDRVLSGSMPHGVDLPAESFDVVLLTDVLEHIEDDRGTASTALRLLRPSGIVVATVPAHQWLFSEYDARHHHFRRYGRRQFRELWTDADVTLLSYYNAFLFPPAVAVRLASRFLPRPASSYGLEIPPSPINRILKRVMASERTLLGRVPMPFGLSLVAVVRRK